MAYFDGCGNAVGRMQVKIFSLLSYMKYEDPLKALQDDLNKFLATLENDLVDSIDHKLVTRTISEEPIHEFIVYYYDLKE